MDRVIRLIVLITLENTQQNIYKYVNLLDVLVSTFNQLHTLGTIFITENGNLVFKIRIY